MNTKQMVTGVLVAALLMTAWYGAAWWVRTTHPEWVFGVERARLEAAQRAAAAGAATTGPTTTSATTGTTTSPTTLPNAEAAGPTTAPGAFTVATGAGEARPIELGSAAKEHKTFAMALSLDPRGAGIARVRLNDFNRGVKDAEPYEFQQPEPGRENQTRPLATRSITINGVVVDLQGAQWALRSGEGATATYALDVTGAAGPVARLEKSFTVPERATPSQGYEVKVDYRIVNLTNAPLKVKTEFNGPAVPPRELAQGDRQVLSGVKNGAAIVPHQFLVQAFDEDEPTRELLVDDDKRPAFWAGGSSAYFNAVLLPISLVDPRQPADYLESIKAGLIDPNERIDATLKKIAITFHTKELTIDAGKTLTLPMAAYFGPRRRETLDTDFYTAIPRAYYNTLVIASGPCWFCTFDWLVNGLVKLLGFFHMIFRDWGLAIIALVVLVRTLLHPITKKSQVNMMKMGKMGPEIEKLKKKHGDNKDELNKAMMQFYKTQGATPILGCLPMFLQMPIWIALWSALQSTFELRHAPFLYGMTWIDDLSKPDALLSWEPVPLFFGITISGLNVLPLLLGVVFFVNQKYTPKPPATTPEQEQQQKMMQWMTLLFPMFLYTGPSGLNLYILTSTTIGIIESKVVRDHIKQREELEKLNGPVIIDAPPTRGSRRKGGDDLGPTAARNKPPEKPSPAGWLAKKLAELQEKAESVKREADRKGR